MTRSFTYSTAISKYLLNNAQCYGKFYYSFPMLGTLKRRGATKNNTANAFFLLTGRRSKIYRAPES